MNLEALRQLYPSKLGMQHSTLVPTPSFYLRLFLHVCVCYLEASSPKMFYGLIRLFIRTEYALNQRFSYRWKRPRDNSGWGTGAKAVENGVRSLFRHVSQATFNTVQI